MKPLATNFQKMAFNLTNNSIQMALQSCVYMTGNIDYEKATEEEIATEKHIGLIYSNLIEVQKLLTPLRGEL